MFTKLSIAIAAAIALGFSSYATSDVSPHLEEAPLDQSWVQTSHHRAAQDMDGWKVELVLKDNVLQHRKIFCIRAPCPYGNAQLDVAVIIKNISEQEQTLHFSSTQMMDVEVLSQAGESVTRLSINRLYGAVLTDLKLAAGEEKVLVDALVLDASVVGDLKVGGMVTSFSTLPRVDLDITVLAAP